MICTYLTQRKVEKHYMAGKEITDTIEYFAECYERDCPLYVPPTETEEEKCKRAD